MGVTTESRGGSPADRRAHPAAPSPGRVDQLHRPFTVVGDASEMSALPSTPARDADRVPSDLRRELGGVTPEAPAPPLVSRAAGAAAASAARCDPCSRAATEPAQLAEPKPRTILVFASAEPGAELIGELRRRRVDADTEVLVVAPALASRLGFWTNDDRWQRCAGEVVARTTRMLAAAGIASRGRIGDADPLQALEDVLRSESVAELIVAHGTAERASRLQRELLRRAGERRVVPTTMLEATGGAPSDAGRRWKRRHARLATAVLLALLLVLVLAAAGSASGRLLVALALPLGIVALNVGPKLAAVAAVWLVVRRRRRRGRA